MKKDIISGVSGEYLFKIDELIRLSLNTSNKLVDTLFKIKSSLLILKGSTFDQQKKNRVV